MYVATSLKEIIMKNANSEISWQLGDINSILSGFTDMLLHCMQKYKVHNWKAYIIFNVGKFVLNLPIMLVLESLNDRNSIFCTHDNASASRGFAQPRGSLSWVDWAFSHLPLGSNVHLLKALMCFRWILNYFGNI